MEEEEDDREEEDDEEKVEDCIDGNKCKVLLIDVWHIIAVVSYGLCSTWGLDNLVDLVDPEYRFQNKQEVQEYLPGFLSQVEKIWSLTKALVEQQGPGSEEDRLDEVIYLTEILNMFKENNKIRMVKVIVK